MEHNGNLSLLQQNLMLAIRREMGWPEFKPANDCIGFSSGRPMDLETGAELGRVAQMLAKDIVYSGWKSVTAREPVSFCIAYRELLTVDIVDRVIPYAANDDDPIVMVSTTSDEHFAVDRRGSLTRMPGKPKNIAKGRKLAMKRIKAAAATMGDALLASNRWVPTGATSVDPDAETDTVVRFG